MKHVESLLTVLRELAVTDPDDVREACQLLLDDLGHEPEAEAWAAGLVDSFVNTEETTETDPKKVN